VFHGQAIRRTTRLAIKPIGWHPIRGLRREEAARYVGVSATKFDQLVADGRMPKGIRIDGRVVWDIQIPIPQPAPA
jgi:predicted DNA-binding transcriptional regulator AlpA